MTDESTDISAAALRGVNTYWRALDAEAIRKGAHRELVGGLWEDIGRLQFDFLVAAGLQPRHRLLDVGCGALRGGVQFVRHLDPGRYCGIDANASLIEAGRQELAAAGLDGRGARLLADADFGVARFGERFEFALAVSLFTHLYLNHIQICLARVAAVLAPGGRFHATFFEAPAPAHLEPITQQPGGHVTHYAEDPFHQSFAELSALAGNAGLAAERIGDFGHPRGQRMIVFHA
ncbi:MAG TPA: class I SAM-dependent methyltransferase [Rhodanobacteraceae bacterium]|nr:class I SAM-dependent methyltransferase [Rhodanobacteraceae bacterium]